MWLVRSRMARLVISAPLSLTIVACLPRRRIRASCSCSTPIISASLNLHVRASLAFGSRPSARVADSHSNRGGKKGVGQVQAPNHISIYPPITLVRMSVSHAASSILVSVLDNFGLSSLPTTDARCASEPTSVFCSFALTNAGFTVTSIW